MISKVLVKFLREAREGGDVGSHLRKLFLSFVVRNVQSFERVKRESEGGGRGSTAPHCRQQIQCANSNVIPNPQRTAVQKICYFGEEKLKLVVIQVAVV